MGMSTTKGFRVEYKLASGFVAHAAPLAGRPRRSHAEPRGRRTTL